MDLDGKRIRRWTLDGNQAFFPTKTSFRQLLESHNNDLRIVQGGVASPMLIINATTKVSIKTVAPMQTFIRPDRVAVAKAQHILHGGKQQSQCRAEEPEFAS